MRAIVYSNFGEYLGELVDIETAEHNQEINGEDTLALTTTDTILAKYDRVLWSTGEDWHEHVVNETGQTHTLGETHEYTLESSMQVDLRRAYIDVCVMTDVAASEALAIMLEQTAWEVGEVDDFGAAQVVLSDMTGWEALHEIAGVFGGEFYPSIAVDARGVTTRRVNLVRTMGGFYGARFEYSHNMEGVTKNILADDVYTAVYGFGKNLESNTDGVTDRLTFASINGGVPYVEAEDPEAIQRWGVIGPGGQLIHSFGCYVNSECEDKQQLLDETRAYHAEHSAPAVSYTVQRIFDGLIHSGLGDTVQVIDLDFTPELRLQARIGALTRDLLNDVVTSATFGTVVSILPDVLTRTYQQSQRAITTANALMDTSGKAIASAAETLEQIGREVNTQTVTTKTVVLSDGGATGTLTVKADGLYFNNTKIS